MADAEMTAELQGVQAGEERRRGSNASQAVDCCMETMVEQIFAMGADQARSEFDAMCQIVKKFEANTPSSQMPGKEGGRRNGEDEQEQGKASQQLALAASGGFNEGTPASSMELDLPRVRGAHGECGGAGSSGTAQDRERSRSSTPRGWRSDGRGCTLVRIVNGDGMRELFVKNKKKRETARVRTQGPLKKTAKAGT